MSDVLVPPAVRPIEDFALIGSTEGAALVHRDGTIEWLCMPRFDSEAIFAAILGNRDNGAWQLFTPNPVVRIERRYLPDTMVLETSITTAQGKALVFDFMPAPATGGTHELVRVV